MDDPKPTPETKTSAIKGKKPLLVLIVLVLLAAAGAGGYLVWKNNDKKADQNASQQDPEDTPAPNGNLTEEQVEEVRTRYENTKTLLPDSKNKPVADQITLYASAAFDGAQLNDPQAKEFAQEALDLMPDDATTDEKNKEFESYFTILTEISKGNYGPAQGVVNLESVEQPE